MHVLIVGGGLGGLGLAQSLRKQGISFEIFERDENADSRFQGWAIGLHTYVLMRSDLLVAINDLKVLSMISKKLFPRTLAT